MLDAALAATEVRISTMPSGYAELDAHSAWVRCRAVDRTAITPGVSDNTPAAMERLHSVFRHTCLDLLADQGCAGRSRRIERNFDAQTADGCFTRQRLNQHAAASYWPASKCAGAIPIEQRIKWIVRGNMPSNLKPIDRLFGFAALVAACGRS